MKDEASFLGRGWSFPPRFNDRMNELELVESEEDIRESLTILFSTRKGERFAFPEFGSGVHELILETMNPALEDEIVTAVKTAIQIYEPRVDVTDVNVEFVEEEGIVYVGIEYLIRAINVRTNMVYPFYKLEGTDLPKNI